MARQKDRSPIPHTCPLIDKVVNFIDGIQWDESEADLREDAIEAMKTLEEIRTANSTLREWGNDEALRAEEFDEDIDDLRRKIETLEEQITDLENQLSEAEQVS